MIAAPIQSSELVSTLPGFLPEDEWTKKYKIKLTDKPQAFARLPREAYDELPGISQSLIKSDRTQAHIELNLYKDKEEQKKDFLIGNICHCDALEPETFGERYVVIPDDAPSRPTESQLTPPKPKKDGTISTDTKQYQSFRNALDAQQWWKIFDAEHNRKEIISKSDMDQGIALSQALKKHPVIGAYLTHDKRDSNEITLTYIDIQTGLRLKARLDMLRVFPRQLQLWIGDVKTTHDAAPGPDHFGKSAVNFGYLFQAAYYSDAVFHCKRSIESVLALPANALIGFDIIYEWIAIEKTKRPHYKFISRQQCPEELLDLGRQQYRKALNAFHASLMSGYFAGYSTEATPLQIPGWAYGKIINELEES